MAGERVVRYLARRRGGTAAAVRTQDPVVVAGEGVGSTRTQDLQCEIRLRERGALYARRKVTGERAAGDDGAGCCVEPSLDQEPGPIGRILDRRAGHVQLRQCAASVEDRHVAFERGAEHAVANAGWISSGRNASDQAVERVVGLVTEADRALLGCGPISRKTRPIQNEPVHAGAEDTIACGVVDVHPRQRDVACAVQRDGITARVLKRTASSVPGGTTVTADRRTARGPVGAQ